eukprot:360538_1
MAQTANESNNHNGATSKRRSGRFSQFNTMLKEYGLLLKMNPNPHQCKDEMHCHQTHQCKEEMMHKIRCKDEIMHHIPFKCKDKVLTSCGMHYVSKFVLRKGKDCFVVYLHNIYWISVTSFMER